MKKLVKFIRVVLAVALAIGWYQCMKALIVYHVDSCPELYGVEINRLLAYLPLLGVFAIVPFPVAAAALLSGYKLVRLRWFFLEISKPDKLRIRLTKKLGLGAQVLPPRTDGSSPYALYWLSGNIYLVALALLLGLLTALLWRMPAARYLNIWFCAMMMACLVPLLPTKNSSLDRVLAFRNSRDLRRAWECSLYLNAAMGKKEKLSDMPEEWFLPYPAELKDHPLVMYANFNRAAWLISKDRWMEGYAELQYFFDLVPAPKTHTMIASAILNGVVCEVLGDLPYMCLSQLDHPSLKLPLPPAWETQRLQAEYARALFLHHDEVEAAAILPKLEAALEKDGRTREGIEKLQRKAGLLTDDVPAKKGEDA